MDTGGTPPPVRMTPHLVFGVLIILVGVLFTLDNLEITDAEKYLRYWPVGLIALGLAKLRSAKDGHSAPLSGVLFVIAGGWLLLDNLNLIDVRLLDIWPVLLIAAGSVMVWQALRGRPARVAARTEDTITAVAILGGITRGTNSSAFRGGELFAFMGGCEIDLRQAAIHGEAVIDIFAMWGGIEIRVPDGWRVIGRVTPIMGAFEDTTRPPHGETTHTLVVRGVVLMGGVDVKN
jgi:predicted membrane protein